MAASSPFESIRKLVGMDKGFRREVKNSIKISILPRFSGRALPLSKPKPKRDSSDHPSKVAASWPSVVNPSALRAKMVAPRSNIFSWFSANSLNSWRQSSHQAAHRFTRTGFPINSRVDFKLPSLPV